MAKKGTTHQLGGVALPTNTTQADPVKARITLIQTKKSKERSA